MGFHSFRSAAAFAQATRAHAAPSARPSLTAPLSLACACLPTPSSSVGLNSADGVDVSWVTSLLLGEQRALGLAAGAQQGCCVWVMASCS